MIFERSYAQPKINEVVIVTDGESYPVWNKDYDKYFSHLERGDVIEGELYERLIDLATRRQIKKSALRKITASNITRKELIRKVGSEMCFGSYPRRDVVEEIVNKLVKAGLINEEGYAKRFLEKCLEKYYGEKRIRYEMREKGFEDRYIESAFADREIDFTEICGSAIEKKFADLEKSKMYKKLFDLGHDNCDIETAIDNCKRKKEEN